MKQLLFLIIVLFLSGCTGNSGSSIKVTNLTQWKFANGKIKVLSTVEMINDLVKQIGGDHVDTLTLIQGNLDPHSYQLVKGDDEKFAFADIIFYNGLGLEHSYSIQQLLQSHENALGLGNVIQEQVPEQILMYQGQLDPHIWLDVSLWAQAIPIITQALSRQDPSHQDFYRERGNELMTHLMQFHKEVQDQINTIPTSKRYLVTSHDAFNYFTRAYLATDEERENGSWQERFAAPEGLAPDSQLSTAEIQNILQHLKTYNIQVLFPESNLNRDSLRKLIASGREQGLELHLVEPTLYADAMGAPGSNGDTYQKMIQHNVNVLKKWWSQ